MSTLPAKATTSFVIRPSHYRARLDANGGVVDRRQRVLCGALGGDGRYTCGEEIASVVVRGRNMDWRELVMGPGWIIDDGVWRPTKNLCWRQGHGYESRFRKPQRVMSEGKSKGRLEQRGRYVTHFPSVAVCCEEHVNILEADRLNVVTEDDRMRAHGLTK